MLIDTKEFQKAACIYAYCSYNQEVRTGQILREAWKQGKRLAVPRVVGEDMIFHYIASEEDLVPGTFGILEPKAHLPVADGDCPEVFMILPGVAFDKTGHRVGYGRGYYDRYLNRWKDQVHFIKMALCYDFQIVEEIDREVHDEKVDILISAPSKGILIMGEYESEKAEKRIS